MWWWWRARMCVFAHVRAPQQWCRGWGCKCQTWCSTLTQSSNPSVVGIKNGTMAGPMWCMNVWIEFLLPPHVCGVWVYEPISFCCERIGPRQFTCGVWAVFVNVCIAVFLLPWSPHTHANKHANARTHSSTCATHKLSHVCIYAHIMHTHTRSRTRTLSLTHTTQPKRRQDVGGGPGHPPTEATLRTEH